MLANQSTRASILSEQFRRLFGSTARIYRSPGRVNLIGEHTDYNQGFVMPAALDLTCWVAAAPRGDGKLIVESRPRTNTGHGRTRTDTEQPPKNSHRRTRTNTEEQPRTNSHRRTRTHTEQPRKNSHRRTRTDTEEQPRTNSHRRTRTNTEKQPPTNTDEHGGRGVAKRFERDLSQPLVPSGDWSDYIVGVIAVLRERGHHVVAATLLIESDVPIGAGLSSSAALEVGAAIALLDLSGITLDGVTVAAVCQQAENEFVGARCGIMDQFVACHGRAGEAVMLDCRSLDYRLLPLPPCLRLVACNSMVRHAIAGGEYRRRREECEAAVAQLAVHIPRLESLRDLDLAKLESAGETLPSVLFRRAKHVVTENLRVQQAAAAFERGDLPALGPLMAASHLSLRTDFEVSCRELDVLVELAEDMPGVYGSRMTGGGFGGCTVNLVHEDAIEEFCRHMVPEYERRTGRRPEIYVSQAADAAARVD